MRATSVEAYLEVQASGRLNEQAKKVYALLYEKDPLTARQIDKLLAKPGEASASWHKRLPDPGRWKLARVVLTKPVSPMNTTFQKNPSWRRPEPAVIDKAVADLRDPYKITKQHGLVFTPALERWRSG